MRDTTLERIPGAEHLSGLWEAGTFVLVTPRNRSSHLCNPR